MPAQDKEQKTEKATPQRREEARKKGQVARSQELGTALVLLLAAVALYFTGPAASEKFRGIFTFCLSEQINKPLSAQVGITLLSSVGTAAVWAIAPLMGCVLAAGLAASFGQVGFMIAEDALSLKLERLDPVQGTKRLFSAKSLAKLGTSLAKVAVVGVAAYAYVHYRMEDFPPLLSCTVPAIYSAICQWAFELVLVIALAFLLIAAVDYAFQRWDFEREIRMSKQEVKDELKRSEGDPLVKNRVREIQREMANKRMMQDVPSADVVVKNPTHFAVALTYQPGKDNAPSVVAKGMNLVAQKILDIARESDVPEVENKPLAQTLYRTVEVGNEIPPELYKAVAEVLAYVYRLKSSDKGKNIARKHNG